jgi:hypothetical protein
VSGVDGFEQVVVQLVAQAGEQVQAQAGVGEEVVGEPFGEAAQDAEEFDGVGEGVAGVVVGVGAQVGGVVDGDSSTAGPANFMWFRLRVMVCSSGIKRAAA